MNFSMVNSNGEISVFLVECRIDLGQRGIRDLTSTIGGIRDCNCSSEVEIFTSANGRIFVRKWERSGVV